MSYKIDLEKIPDWAGTAVISIVTGVVGFACMWGSLKSEVQAQVTAQAIDASDIKTLISGQADIKATVDGLAKDVEQQHQDFLALMDSNASRDDSSALSGPRVSK